MGKLIIYTKNDLASALESLTDTKLLLGSDKLDVTDTNYQLTVKSNHYEKQIYKPCELEITFSCMENEEEKIVAQPGSNATNNKQTNPPTGGNSPANAQNSDKKITLPKALKSLFFYEKKDGTMVKAATKIDVAVAQVNTTVFYVAKNYYVHSFSLKKNVAEEKANNLPEAMIQNIANGRMKKFFKESCLLNQEYIQDSKLSVAEYLKAANKELTVVDFKRFTLRAE